MADFLSTPDSDPFEDAHLAPRPKFNPNGDGNAYDDPSYIPSEGAVALVQRGCFTNARGHVPHWIQMKIAYRNPMYDVRALRVDGNYLSFVTEAGTFCMWNHDPQKLQAAVDIALTDPDAEVKYSHRTDVLVITSGDTGFAFSMGEEPSECEVAY